MAVPTRAFVSKIATVHACALAHEDDAVGVGHLVAAHPFTAAVPDAEDDAALRGTVDLHAEVTAMPSAGHIVGGDGVLHAGHLAVKGGDVRALGAGIGEMDGGGVAARLEVEVRIVRGHAVEHERREIAEGLARRVQRFKREPLVASFFDGEFSEARGDKICACTSHFRVIRLTSDGEAQLGSRVDRQP